jgi:hypothetical protein
MPNNTHFLGINTSKRSLISNRANSRIVGHSETIQKWDEQVFEIAETVSHKKTAQHLIAEVPSRHSPTEITIGVDLGDVWSHYCTINQNGEVIDRGRFRTNPQGVEKWF